MSKAEVDVERNDWGICMGCPTITECYNDGCLLCPDARDQFKEDPKTHPMLPAPKPNSFPRGASHVGSEWKPEQ